MRKAKQILALILLACMILTSHSFYVFAEGLSNGNSEQNSEQVQVLDNEEKKEKVEKDSDDSEEEATASDLIEKEGEGSTGDKKSDSEEKEDDEATGDLEATSSETNETDETDATEETTKASEEDKTNLNETTESENKKDVVEDSSFGSNPQADERIYVYFKDNWGEELTDKYCITPDKPPVTGVEYDTWQSWIDEAVQDISDEVKFKGFLRTDKPIEDYGYEKARSIYTNGYYEPYVRNSWHWIDFDGAGVINGPTYFYACYTILHDWTFVNDETKGTYKGQARYLDVDGDKFNEDKEAGLFNIEAKDGYKFVGWKRVDTDNHLVQPEDLTWPGSDLDNWSFSTKFEARYIEVKDTVHNFNSSWMSKLPISKDEVTKITIQKSNTHPNINNKVDLDENGLTLYVNSDNEVIINCAEDDMIYVTSAECLFYDFENLKEIKGLGNLNTSEITVFDKFVFNDRKLEKIDIENLDTSNILQARLMFCQTDSLKELDLSNFNPNKNKFYAWLMFSHCGVERIDLTGRANFDGHSTDIFAFCKNLKEVIMKDSDTSEWESLYDLFMDCESLERVDMSNCDLSQYLQYDEVNRGIWEGCDSLKEIIFDGVKFPRDCKNFFWGCSNAEVISISGADFSEVESLHGFFMSCKALKKVDFSNADFSRLKDSDGMFLHCNGLDELDLSGLDLDKFNNSTAFYTGTTWQDVWGDWNNTTVGIKVLKLNDTTFTDRRPFDKRVLNPEINPFIQKIEMRNVTFPKYSKEIFKGLTNVKEIDLSGADTSNVADFNSLFLNCKKLEKLDLSGFDVSKVVNFDSMFENCESLKEIKGISEWDTHFADSINNMFKNCKSLENIDLSNWDTDNLWEANGVFNGAGLEEVKLFNAHNIKTFDEMFANCESLKILDLTPLEITKNFTYTDDETGISLTADYRAFESANNLVDNCVSLEEIDLSSFGANPVDLSTLTNLQTVVLSKDISTVVKEMNLTGKWLNETTNKVVDFNVDTINQDGPVRYTKADGAVVIFNVGSGKAIPRLNVSIGSTVKFSEYGKKTSLLGYEFDGWYKEDTYQTPITDDYIINGPIIVYAKWKKVTYKVDLIIDTNKYAYWRNDVTYKNGTPSNIVRNAEDEYILPTAEDFVSAGWSFDGWYDNFKATGEKITKVEAGTHGDKTFYANFKRKRFKINYHLNGGRFVSDDELYPNHSTNGYISKLEIPYEFEYDDYIRIPTTVKGPNENEYLVGWYRTPDFSDEPLKIGLYVQDEVAGDLELYAKYGIKHKIIYDPNETDISNQFAYKQVYKYYDEDSEITLEPMKSMYSDALWKFLGWEDENGNAYEDEAKIGKLTGDLKLLAKWEYLGLQTYERIRRTGGTRGGSGGGGGGGGGGGASMGTMPMNDNKPLLPNEGRAIVLAEDPTMLEQIKQGFLTNDIVPSVTNGILPYNLGKIHVNDEGVNWVYNPIDNSWSLNNKGENVKGGFYTIARTDDMLVNGTTIWPVYNDLATYCFDSNGKMVTGWVNDTAGNTYFFENTPNAMSQGMMLQGASVIQGDIYFFKWGSGKMARDERIDGHYFGPDGKYDPFK